MDGYDHSDSGSPPAAPEQSVDGGRRSLQSAAANLPSGLGIDDTAFHDPNDGRGDGKSRRTAPWPFLIRRLG